MMASTIEPKPTCFSSCRRTWLIAGTVPAGSSRSGCSFSQPRPTTITSPPKFGLCAMLRRVRIGIGASRRVDGDAAAIDVLEADDVVDVRIFRQQLRRMRSIAKSSTPATHCTVVVIASMLRVPTEPSALR